MEAGQFYSSCIKFTFNTWEKQCSGVELGVINIHMTPTSIFPNLDRIKIQLVWKFMT